MRKFALVGSGGAFAAVLVFAASCASSGASSGERAARVAPIRHVDGPGMGEMTPKNLPGLHNVVAYHPDYWSGSAPEGDEGFDTLAGMGVKTIITVDGAAPDVQKAAARGMRYIHLPIGYNGFDEARKLELVRATRDAMRDGPVYVHCHHGKHRSAGAAATVVASLGWMTGEEAVARMKVSGTAPGYKGLYASAANACVLDPARIDAVPDDFPSVSRPAGFVKMMVELDEASEHLKEIEAAGWAVPKDHPDLVPAAISGHLADLLRLAAETDKAKSRPAEFAATLRKNNAEAQALEDMIVVGNADPKQLSAQFKVMSETCKSCHVKFRD